MKCFYPIGKIEPDQHKDPAGKKQLVDGRTLINPVDLFVVLVFPGPGQRSDGSRDDAALGSLDQAGYILRQGENAGKSQSVGHYGSNHDRIEYIGNIIDQATAPDKGTQHDNLFIKFPGYP